MQKTEKNRIIRKYLYRDIRIRIRMSRQKDYFKDYMRTLVGRGTEFSVIQPELAENLGAPVLCGVDTQK